jgi:N-methylhydantoinase A
MSRRPSTAEYHLGGLETLYDPFYPQKFFAFHFLLQWYDAAHLEHLFEIVWVWKINNIDLKRHCFMKRIAIDIGGTFTDIVYIDEDTMEIIVDKVRSTPWDIGQAVMDAIKKIKVDMSKIDLFIHGTTVGINTIVQEKGSKVGLISTEGFTDVLEMGRGNKKELYNYMEKKPKPLVPRYLRMPVRERITHTGEVLEKIDENEVKNIINKFKSHGVEAIAVCLLHAHVNPENEIRLGKIIQNEWPDVTLALSHQVAREIREYERTSTTVINAYIEKAVVHYLYGLEENLKEAKFVGQLLVLGSSGILGIEAIKERSIHTLASGPIV